MAKVSRIREHPYTAAVAEDLHRLVHYTNVVDATLSQAETILASRQIFQALSRLRQNGLDPYKQIPPTFKENVSATAIELVQDRCGEGVRSESAHCDRGAETHSETERP